MVVEASFLNCSRELYSCEAQDLELLTGSSEGSKCSYKNKMLHMVCSALSTFSSLGKQRFASPSRVDFYVHHHCITLHISHHFYCVLLCFRPLESNAGLQPRDLKRAGCQPVISIWIRANELIESRQRTIAVSYHWEVLEGSNAVSGTCKTYLFIRTFVRRGNASRRALCSVLATPSFRANCTPPHAAHNHITCTLFFENEQRFITPAA